MNTKNEYAEKALKLTTLLTLLVAGYEVARACGGYKEGMNFLDIASYATADLNTYCMVLILANLILLPSAVLLYKQSGMSLKDEIFDKKSLFKDILLGFVLAGVSAAISLLSLLVINGRTDLAFHGWDKISVSEIILMAISLVLGGMCRAYYVDEEGNDITRGFSIPGTLCMDEGLFGYLESIVTWETIEETTLMIFNVEEMKDIILKTDELKNVYIMLLENALRYKIYRENEFLVENATERYLHFRKLYPMICGKVKQHQLASYLGMKPESLSRIKKTLKEN